MIKRQIHETYTTQTDSGRRGHRRGTQTASVVPVLLLVAAAIASFFVGAHLRRWIHAKPAPVKIDAATLVVLPSDNGPDIVLTTPDDRRAIVCSDLSPAAVAQMSQYLAVQHITSANAVIITSVSRDSAAGLLALLQQVKLTGPIVTPYSSASSDEWWGEIQNDFVSSLTSAGHKTAGWNHVRSVLQSALPEANITLITPKISPWESPVIAANAAYGTSSLLDLSSLTAKQVASLTGAPEVGRSRILVIAGQDPFVTKEILAQVQPDLVLMAGSNDAAPGDNAVINVQAADAQGVTLAGSPNLKLTLPSSDTQPLKSTRL